MTSNTLLSDPAQAQLRPRVHDIERDIIDCLGMADALLTVSLYQVEYPDDRLRGGYSGATWLASELKSRLGAMQDKLGAPFTETKVSV